MNWRRLSIVPYRVRLLLRAAFVFLMAATVGLALSVLQQEKQLSYKNYEGSFQKTRVQVAATLRHPTGQLALLNPQPAASGGVLHPLLLPFAALDFDDLQKVQQAVAMSGCQAQYGNNGSLCVGIGNNPWAGGFIYVAGSFDSAPLVPHVRGDQIVDKAHRVRVKVALRGQTYEWIAPFEESSEPQTPGRRYGGMRGRLTGFTAADVARGKAPVVKDFRGWIWQSPRCNRADLADDDASCARSAFFSLRLPIAVLQDALFEQRRPEWPPADLDRINVSIAVLAPGDGAPLLDSGTGPAAPPFSLSDLKAMLLPGESLQIRRLSDGVALPELVAPIDPEDQSWHFVTALIRRLPVDAYDVPLSAREVIVTPVGSYEVLLKGDVRSVSKSLSVVASRLVWFVGAMLAALMLAWLVIEIGIIRRIKVLIKRADDVGERVKAAHGFSEADLADLRGQDELGVLATALHDLLRRVREDVERENIRAEQERNMWHAVGHEIMSPLQSLMVLHGAPEDQSHRYISRMQQAIRVLYGRASPSEAFQSSELQIAEIDLAAFLHNVAANASCVGIENVVFHGAADAVSARADEYSLEDVVTHVLRNAQRYRKPDTPIDITLDAGDTGAVISIHNQGPPIAPDMLDKIFEYGVSDQPESGAEGNRGQGLFVARTYMAKMGGTIVAQNRTGGVSFILSLQRGA
ncbi:signal transduction histidine kinase [Duganella sp. 1224]|uniref:sensor histidine kinase n=1 Tax=Duganella sp. 1224 TaxID=2587052 RepID=UPI0015CB1BDB|nr:HAMP domain-containing sensor histidine kinase [Duganella sp. 1224]NYE64225.1 signal transduction histidine kinase [Duganella sp. 1224]